MNFDGLASAGEIVAGRNRSGNEPDSLGNRIAGFARRLSANSGLMKRLIIGALAVFALLAPAAEAKHKDRFPATIALPLEWRPEGIASGRGTDFYVGSIPQGAVWKGDYRTGQGATRPAASGPQPHRR